MRTFYLMFSFIPSLRCRRRGREEVWRRGGVEESGRNSSLSLLLPFLFPRFPRPPYASASQINLFLSVGMLFLNVS